MSAPPRNSRGEPWTGELLTCRECGATHPDRNDLPNDESCPRATARWRWHHWIYPYPEFEARRTGWPL